MKLWQKNFTVNKLLETFTVGIDWQLDLSLVPADCMASVAHARTLRKIGILTGPELEQIETGLREIASLAAAGKFTIRPEDEDCHTAIEQHLTARSGESGKKVHTGRSRNDQVLTALRLYEKAMVLSVRQAALDLARVALEFARTHEFVPMPGRTHTQTGMPSSVGLWAGSLAQQVLDDSELLAGAFDLVDRSPLGAAAGYGVPLALDREFSAREMGFADVHLNVLASQNSRGKLESVLLDACDQACLTLSKFAQDLILFSLPELGYFSLPAEMTTGSSIMPQKKNPDGLELLRSRSALVSGWAVQAKSIVRSLPTGYNRDFQDTKEAIIRGLETTRDCLQIFALTMEKLEVNQERLRAAFDPSIFATDEALRLVSGGMSFRDAYRHVGTHLDELSLWDADRAIRERVSCGTPGNLCLERLDEAREALAAELEADSQPLAEAVERLLGPDISLVRSQGERMLPGLRVRTFCG